MGRHPERGHRARGDGGSARAMARVSGMPDYPFVTVPYPHIRYGVGRRRDRRVAVRGAATAGPASPTTVIRHERRAGRDRGRDQRERPPSATPTYRSRPRRSAPTRRAASPRARPSSTRTTTTSGWAASRRHDAYLDAWAQLLAERPDALWYPTLCVAPARWRSSARAAVAEAVPLRMAAVDPGSTNLGAPGADGLPDGGVYANWYGEIRAGFECCAEHGSVPRSRSTSPGSCVRARLLPRRPPAGGSMVKLYFGGE